MKTSKLILLVLLLLSMVSCNFPGFIPAMIDLTNQPVSPTSTDAFPSTSSPDATTPGGTDNEPTPVPITDLTPSPASGIFESAQLSFIPNIETAGVYVSGTDLPETAELLYRSDGDATWKMGHRMVQIDDGRLAGSLFNLLPGTSCAVKVINGISEISGIFTTQPNELTFTPLTIIHVDDDALAGGDGSARAPYPTIQEGINHASPGTQVLVADGIYHEAITFPTSGTDGKWTQVKAAGMGAILDGSTALDGEWLPVQRLYQVWSIRATGFIGYLARDGKHYYQYDDMSSLKKSRGHGKTTVTEGWFHDMKGDWLYIRSKDDPSTHTWQTAVLSRAFDVNSQQWIWIEGFEMRFYGSQNGSCGICVKNASHIVIRNNRIHNMQLGIYINWNGSDEQGNDTRIENNEIYDPNVDEFEWDAAKGTYMEGTGIVLRGHTGAIVRGNHIHNFFNGIYTGTTDGIDNPEIAFDADIYDNTLDHISDDGLEPEGACVNHRFRDNRVDNMLVGFSNGPITQGPTWVLRNLFTNFSSTSIKWARHPDGTVFIYHNTFWTNEPGLNAMSMITIAHNAILRNNIFQGNGYAFEESHYGSTGNDWDYDNWFSTRDPTSPRFRWETINYLTITQLCESAGLECNGHENPPGLVNPMGGDFTLLPTSPNIDQGIIIPGINDDFSGGGPDIGAYEYGNGY